MKFQVVKNKVKALAVTGAMFISTNLLAAGAPQPSELNNSLAIVLLIVAVSLLLAIGMLAYVLLGAAQVYVERFKEKQKALASAAKTVAIVLFCAIGSSVFAADPPAADAVQAAVSNSIGGLSYSSFYMLVSIIGLELIVLLAMLVYLRQLLAKEKEEIVSVAAVEVVKENTWKKWWEKINSFRPVSEEKEMLLDHEYDGIHELDNRLPPWWLYGFYLTIIFAGIYLYRYHVTGSAPLPQQELQIAMQEAEIKKEEYLKHAANKVDENTVTLKTDASALGEGKKIFTSQCGACHGADGGGIVGPNLTDDYWIHKGGIKDIFKTIKYGVPEKGMKAWKDDFSPVQIAALASYIKTLQGTKPANPKEPQGDIFKEENTAADQQPADKKLAVNK